MESNKSNVYLLPEPKKLEPDTLIVTLDNLNKKLIIGLFTEDQPGVFQRSMSFERGTSFESIIDELPEMIQNIYMDWMSE